MVDKTRLTPLNNTSKMEQSDRVVDDVETLDVDESENKPTEAKASFTGKLDLSSYSYSRSSSLRSARKPSSIRQLNKTVQGDGNKQDEIPTPLKKQTAAAITPRRPIKRKKSSGYAPPSTYAHLQPLPDTLQAGLICVFIGLNPGIVSIHFLIENPQAPTYPSLSLLTLSLASKPQRQDTLMLIHQITSGTFSGNPTSPPHPPNCHRHTPPCYHLYTP